MNNQISSDYRPVIAGLGVTGLSIAKYLAQQQQRFSIVDSRAEPPQLRQWQRWIASHPAEHAIVLGNLDQRILNTASHIYLSPGLSKLTPQIVKAVASGALLTNDIDIFSAYARQHHLPWAAVTGSNGKSTVTAWLQESLHNAGTITMAGGNYGMPVLDIIQMHMRGEIACAVIELSSFQLEICQPLHSLVSVVLNVTSDHTDRYSSMFQYHETKQRVHLQTQWAIENRDDPLTSVFLTQANNTTKIVSFGSSQGDLQQFGILPSPPAAADFAYGSTRLLPTNAIAVAGEHNLLNALAVLALAQGLGHSPVEFAKHICSFKGLRHRGQYVAQIAGAHYINDSKATNPASTIAALQRFCDAPNSVHLILGGDAKGANLQNMATIIAATTKAIYAIGKDAKLIENTFSPIVPVYPCNTLEIAVTQAIQHIAANESLLLSPSCSSLDQFDNFAHRGDVFCTLVAAHSATVVHAQ